jgi:hypothetical protein
MTEPTNTPDPLPCECGAEPYVYTKEGSPEPHDFSGCTRCLSCESDVFMSVELWNEHQSRPQPATASPVTVKPLDLHDAVTHRNAWVRIFNAAIGSAKREEDKSYFEHEKRALVNLLDALSAIQPAAPAPQTVQEAANTDLYNAVEKMIENNGIECIPDNYAQHDISKAMDALSALSDTPAHSKPQG